MFDSNWETTDKECANVERYRDHQGRNVIRSCPSSLFLPLEGRRFKAGDQFVWFLYFLWSQTSWSQRQTKRGLITDEFHWLVERLREVGVKGSTYNC